MIDRNERALQKFLKKHGGQPVGCLAERNPKTGMFDAVTADFHNVQTGEKLASGTKVKIWAGNTVAIVP